MAQQEHQPVDSQGSQWWRYLGLTIALLVVLGGLALLAFLIVIYVGFANYGSNK